MKATKSKKLPKARKGAWFVRVRHSYLPASRRGWLMYIPLITLEAVMLFNTFMIIYNDGNVLLAISELAVGIYLLGVVFTLVARSKS